MMTAGEKPTGQGMVLNSDQESEMVMTPERITKL